MDIQESVSLKGKTTMRIGGNAKYFADISTKEDVEEVVNFAKEKNIPLIMLGGGSNTIFADGEINALVARIAAPNVQMEPLTTHYSLLTVAAGKNLPQLINELAKESIDLSPLTGILGTVGGAIFGNAGQGPQGVWIDSYVKEVTAYVDKEWKIMSKDECNFRYRESFFKDQSQLPTANCQLPAIIWSTTLSIPTKPKAEVLAEIERLIQRRIETQPHVKTAGSCFKAVGDTPAWKLIDEAGLRDTKIGGVEISKKHANFLINDGDGTFEDAVNVVKTVEKGLTSAAEIRKSPLQVEMRFVQQNGKLTY